MPALLGGTGIIGKDIFVKMKAQKSASIQTASGTVVTFPQSAERAFSGLSIYGHSKQDGTPSPENPVPIVSAGSVMTTGAQLFDIKKATSYGSAYGLTVSIDGEEIKISGTVSSVPDDGGALAFRMLNYPESLYGNTFSADIVDDTGVQDCDIYGGQSENAIAIVIGKIPIGTEVNLVFRLMVNSGSTALPWEPYTGGVPGVNPYEGEINISVSDGGTQLQTLTLSTPGGLPGIPVSSGGNYTDENGQRWLCDEIDLARGKYVQRVIELDFDGAETWSTWGVNNLTEGITGFYSYISSGFQKMDINGMLSNLLQYASSAWGGGANGINVSTPNENQYIICSVYNDCLDDISTDDAAIESWKNILNTNNLHVMLILQDPIETDLPAEEIAAYQALHTYSPTTTVSNDAGAWMQVGYNEFNKQTF